MSQSSTWECPECNGTLVSSQGYIVCAECGLVVSREYVAPTYQMGEERDSVGPDAGMFVSLGNRVHVVDGMGSYIGFRKDRYFRDARGRALEGQEQRKFRRLKRVYSTRIRIGKEEPQYRALRTLNRVSKLLMIADQVRDRTAYLYKRILSEIPGRSTNNILLMAVCLLIAVREYGNDAPITLEEIADVFARCGHRVSIRAIVRETLRLRSITGYVPSVRRPEDYVSRVVSAIVNHDEVVRRATARGWKMKEYENSLRSALIRVIENIPVLKRGGRNPFIFAASAAYAADRIIAAEYKRRAVLTQKITSMATNVAEYSIRDHFGVIKSILREMSSTDQKVAFSSK